MTTETKLRAGLVLSILTLLWTTVMWNNTIKTVRVQKNTIDSLTHLSDSLYDASFNNFVEAGRYELTFEHLKEVNPKLGKEMEEWMNHETE
jgi:hypothetical protein